MDTVNLKINEFKQDFLKQFGYDLKISDIQHRVTRTSSVNNSTDIMLTPMKMNAAPMPEGYPVELNHSETGECVYDYLIQAYPALNLTKDFLSDLFGFSGHIMRGKGLQRWRWLPVSTIKRANPADGVNGYMLQRFAEYYSLPMYVLDFKGDVIHHYEPFHSDGRQKTKALMFMIANNHLYPVQDPAERQRIATLVSLVSSTDSPKIISVGASAVRTEIGQLPTNFIDELRDPIDMLSYALDDSQESCVVLKGPHCYKDMETVFAYIYKYENLIPQVKFHKHNLVYLKWGKIHVHASPDAEEIYNASLKFMISYEAQTFAGLANDIMRLFFTEFTDDKGIVWSYKKSSFNEETERAIFGEHQKVPPNHIFSHVAPNELHELRAYDIAKCYSNSLKDNQFDYPVFSELDEVAPYNPQDGMVPGVYYVKTSDFSLFDGNGWYYVPLIAMAKEYELAFTIQYVVKASFSLPAAFFRNMVDFVYQKVPHPTAKNIINHFIGTLRKDEIQEEMHYFTTSFEDILCLRGNYPDAVELPSIYNMFDQKPLHHLMTQKTTRLIDSSKPIRDHLLDVARCKVYQLCQELKSKGCEIIAIKTDCVTVRVPSIYHDEDPIPVGIQIPSPGAPLYPQLYRKDKIHSGITTGTSIIQTSAPSYIFEPPQYTAWQDLKLLEYLKELSSSQDDVGSVLITGKAGTGKSYCIKQLVDIIGSDCLVLATTNIAALNINGQTVHSAFGIRSDNQDKTTVNKWSRIQKAKFIIIDEVSMMTMVLYKTK